MMCFFCCCCWCCLYSDFQPQQDEEFKPYYEQITKFINEAQTESSPSELRWEEKALSSHVRCRFVIEVD